LALLGALGVAAVQLGGLVLERLGLFLQQHGVALGIGLLQAARAL
jgi:hypothetical protein